MMALIFKDWLILKKNKINFIYLIVFGGMFLFSSKDTNFIKFFASSMFMMLVLSTLSYDEFDNGMPMLLTLPSTRKDYVRSKYLLLAFMGISAFIFEIGLLSLGIHFLGIEPMTFIDLVTDILSTILIFSIMILLMIPIQLKYGMRKAMLGMIIVSGGLAVIGFGIFYIIKETEIITQDQLLQAFSWFKEDWQITLLLLGIYLLIVLISYISSQGIMAKKEF